MGVSNLGGIIGAFAPPKLKRIYNNELLQGQIDRSIGGMDQFRAASDEALGGYTAANRRAIEKVGGLQQQSEGEINQMLGSLGGASYMADRERAREGDLAALTGLLGQMGGGMSKGDKIAQSRLGYAGRPSGTYTDKARASYMASFGAPLAGQIFSGLNTAASGSAAERGANIGQRMGLMQARNEMPLQMADLELNPLRARGMAREMEIGQLGDLSGVNKSNLAGFKEQKNKWAAAGEAADESINSAIDTYLSLYSGGLMGGGGGGGRGGGGMLSGIMGGGGRGGTQQYGGMGFYGGMPAYATPGINPNAPYYMPPQQYYQPQPQMYYQPPMPQQGGYYPGPIYGYGQ